MIPYINPPATFVASPDIDIRESVYNDIYGIKSGRPLGRYAVWQKLKRDAHGAPIKSPYAYKVTGEGRMYNRGYATTRFGDLCDEYLIRVFAQPAGRMIVDDTGSVIGSYAKDRLQIVTSYKEPIVQKDVIIFPKIDGEGKLISPVTIKEEWVATISIPRILDDGKVQFYNILAEIQK